MSIRMVRMPSATYIAKKNSNYYSEDDINLTTSIGVLNADTEASLINLVYGKITLNNVQYLISIKDMEMKNNIKNYNSITNIDDIIPFRYAYGNQNGYVIGKGNELSYSINGSEFKINSGRIVVQGVESDIDANGVPFVVDTASSTKQYYTVYYKVNLATNIVSIETKYDIAGYPKIDGGDDLTKTTSGYATLELYHFDVENGVISNVNKLVKAIEYSGTALVGYDINKGTVEERLNALGFKEGSINLNYDATQNKVFRQGNYVFGYAEFSGSPSGTIGTLDEIFRPKETVNIGVKIQAEMSASGGGTGTSVTSDKYYRDIYATIDTDGNIIISNSSLGFTDRESYSQVQAFVSASCYFNIKGIYFGYEANPL